MENKYQLPKEFAEKWLVALRSGEYQQCKNYLYNEDGYCCLGVACLISGIDNDLLIGHMVIPDNENGFDDIPYLLKGSANKKGSLVSMVAPMNDNGKSFNEIADWIQANVEFI